MSAKIEYRDGDPVGLALHTEDVRPLSPTSAFADLIRQARADRDAEFGALLDALEPDERTLAYWDEFDVEGVYLAGFNDARVLLRAALPPSPPKAEAQ